MIDTLPESGPFSVYPGEFRGQSVWFVEEDKGRGRGGTFFPDKGEAERFAKAEMDRFERRRAITRQVAEHQAKEKAEYENLDGFGADLSPAQLGKARAFLNKEFRFRDRILRRKQIIKLLLSEGRVLKENEGYMSLEAATGEYTGRLLLQKIGAEYVSYLTSRETLS